MDMTRYEKVNPDRDTLPTRRAERSRIVKRDDDANKDGAKGNNQPKQEELETQSHRLPDDEVDLHHNSTTVVLTDLRALLNDLIRHHEESELEAVREEAESVTLPQSRRKKPDSDLSSQETVDKSDETYHPDYSAAAQAYESHLFDGSENIETTERTTDEKFRDRTGFLDASLEELVDYFTTIEHLRAMGQETISVMPSQSYGERLDQLNRALRLHDTNSD